MTQIINAVIGPETRIGTLDDPVERPATSATPLTVTLHSGEIIATTLGREKSGRNHAILGWSRAASHYIDLLRAHRQDNPYADMILILAENDLKDRRDEVRLAIAHFKDRQTPGMDPGLWCSKQILKCAMDTGNAHARSLAGFIFEADQLVRHEKASIANGDQTMADIGHKIRAHQKLVRQAIYKSIYWNSHLLPITRAEVRSGNHPNLSSLAKKFGGLPSEAIMSGDLKPRNVPALSDRQETRPFVTLPGRESHQSNGTEIRPQNS